MDVRVGCGDSHVATTTGTDGTYEIVFLPGIIAVRPDTRQEYVPPQGVGLKVRKPGYYEKNRGRGRERLSVADEANVGAASGRGFVLAPNQPHNVDSIMLPAVRIEGRLVAEGGKPIKDQQITVYATAVLPHAWDTAGCAQTETDGRFQIDDLPRGALKFGWCEAVGENRIRTVGSATVDFKAPGLYRGELRYDPKARSTLQWLPKAGPSPRR